MASSVRSRPNHYQTLGLTPAASDEEIKQAFTTKMGLFGAHPLGEAAQLCIAYETLRDAAKRRDYDRSLGLTPVPEGSQWGFGLAQKRWRPFIAAGPSDAPLEQVPPVSTAEPHVAAQPQPDPQPEPEPQPRPEPELRPEPRVASFIAASLRDLARPMDEAPAPQPQPQPRQSPLLALSERKPEPRMEPRIEEILAARPVEEDSFGYAQEERTFDLKRPVLAVGGFVLAAGLIGTLAGVSLKDDVQSSQPEPGVTIPVPAAKQRAAVAAPVAAVETPDQQFVPVDSPAPRSRHSASRQRFTRWAQQQAQQDQPVMNAATQSPGVETASDQLANDPLAPKPVEASMPLPNKVVARTIERIGYSCGEVSSTSAVEGSAGSYNVTCSSGQTYQATPVHGKYRFRRSGSH